MHNIHDIKSIFNQCFIYLTSNIEILMGVKYYICNVAMRQVTSPNNVHFQFNKF